MFFLAFSPIFLAFKSFYLFYSLAVCSILGSRLNPWCRLQLCCRPHTPFLTWPSVLILPSLLIPWLWTSDSPCLWLSVKNLSVYRYVSHVEGDYWSNTLNISQQSSLILQLMGVFGRQTQVCAPQPLSLWVPICPQEASKHFLLGWLKDF